MRGSTAAAVAALLAVALGWPGPAAAQPVPPPPPGPPPSLAVPILWQPLSPAGPGVLAQQGVPDPGPLGLPPVAGLDAGTVLGQNAAPSAPGVGPGIPPHLGVFHNAYGVPQHVVPSAPGEGPQFDVAPGQENAPTGAREWLGRYVDLYRDGRLRGQLLGQRPQEQLGQPLPGTAPPPGTNLPPGPAR